MTLSEFNDRIALIDYVLRKIEPIADHKWFCEECGRFLESNELRYSTGYRSYYCTNHPKNDVSEELSRYAYTRIAEELKETLKSWREE